MNNHSEDFVDPGNSEVHTQDIERLWRAIKEWVRRPDIRATFLRQYIGRYLFLHSCKGGKEVHNFLREPARLCPPQSETTILQQSGAPVPSLSGDSSSDEDMPEAGPSRSHH